MPFSVATQGIFSHLKSFLEQIDEAKYREQHGSLSNSTLGQHTRHTIEFFQCLAEQQESGTINYDKRSRNLMIEEHPLAALQALEKISERFSNTMADKPLQLETTFSHKEDDFTLIPTSFQREWSYVLEHAIHHMAIIKIGVKLVAPGVALPENFGVAPSTVKYRQRQCAQ